MKVTQTCKMTIDLGQDEVLVMQDIDPMAIVTINKNVSRTIVLNKEEWEALKYICIAAQTFMQYQSWSELVDALGLKTEQDQAMRQLAAAVTNIGPQPPP